MHGTGLNRFRAGQGLDLELLRKYPLVLTTYDTLDRHQLSLLRVDWASVVLDEAQAIKNPEAVRTRAARGLKRTFGICSTGTPVENRLLKFCEITIMSSA